MILGGGNPPFPRVLYETLDWVHVCHVCAPMMSFTDLFKARLRGSWQAMKQKGQGDQAFHAHIYPHCMYMPPPFNIPRSAPELETSFADKS